MVLASSSAAKRPLRCLFFMKFERAVSSWTAVPDLIDGPVARLPQNLIFGLV